MKTLYNSDGEAKEMDSVDAREHLETGRWFEQPPVKHEVKREVVAPVIEDDKPAARKPRGK